MTVRVWYRGEHQCVAQAKAHHSRGEVVVTVWLPPTPPSAHQSLVLWAGAGIQLATDSLPTSFFWCGASCVHFPLGYSDACHPPPTTPRVFVISAVVRGRVGQFGAVCFVQSGGFWNTFYRFQFRYYNVLSLEYFSFFIAQKFEFIWKVFLIFIFDSNNT